VSGQLEISLIKGSSFLDLREAWPSSGHPPPEQPNMRMKKEEMVLQLVFRVPAETLHATTAPVCPPPFSHSPNPRRVCVARPPDGCTNVVGLFFRASTPHSFVSWEARLQRAQRGDSSRSRGREDGLSFQTSTLSQANIYRASLMGDQATMKRRLGAVDGRRSVDSNACRRLQP
jgi:hypothetical protein